MVTTVPWVGMVPENEAEPVGADSRIVDHKARKSVKEALGELVNFSCKQFHPEVVSVALIVLKDVEIDFSSLDNFIRRQIPHGHDVNKSWKQEEFSRQFIKKIQLLTEQ